MSTIAELITPRPAEPEVRFKRVLGLPGARLLRARLHGAAHGLDDVRHRHDLDRGPPAARLPVTTIAMAAHGLQLRADGHRAADRRVGVQLRLARVRPPARLHGRLGAAARLHLPADDQLPGHRALHAGLLPEHAAGAVGHPRGGPRHRAEHPRHQAAGQHEPHLRRRAVRVHRRLRGDGDRRHHQRRRGRSRSPRRSIDSDTDLGLVFAGAAILALSFLGFDAVSTLSEETEDPRAQDPAGDHAVRARRRRSSTSSSPTSATSRSRTSASFADHQDVGQRRRHDGDRRRLPELASSPPPTWRRCFACAMASQASVSRILFAMGRDGSLPKPVFARLHPRFRTPVAGNVLVGLFGLTALFISLAPSRR